MLLPMTTMSTNPPRPQESAMLGDSWVVESDPGNNEELNDSHRKAPATLKETRTEPNRPNHDLSHSISTSASTLSGSELIMPSIHETPLAESSWVAPTLKPKSPLRNQELKRRPQATSAPGNQPQQQSHTSQKHAEQASHTKSASAPANNSSKLPWTIFRLAINTLLALAIMHLLVLPELVHQHQSLCTITPIPTLYSTSCTPPPFSNNNNAATTKPTTPQAALHTVQTRLETLFNKTLHEMAPLNSTLRQSEKALRATQAKLKPAFPNNKQELDLEFGGCWTATRSAGWKFDSLIADVRSAIDNLVVTAGNTKKHGHGAAAARPRKQPQQLDSLLWTQMLRREQYLDELTIRMRSKAEDLRHDLARLDDYLEAIGAIIDRERKTPASGSRSSLRRSFWDAVGSIIPGDGVKRESQPPGTSADISLKKLFQDAAAIHQPVSTVVDNLTYRLHAFQAKKEKGNLGMP